MDIIGILALVGAIWLVVLAVVVGTVRGSGRARPRAVRQRPARHHAGSSTMAFLPVSSSGGDCSGDGGFAGGDCGGGGGSF